MSLPKDFDWKFYLDHYEDLRKAGLKTRDDAKSHYLKHGRLEGRIFSNRSIEIFYSKYQSYFNSFNKNKKRIIFINHNESLTGAPFLLKEIIRYEELKAEFEVWVISLTPGNDDSWNEFKTLSYHSIPGSTEIEKCKFITDLFSPVLIYANTIASLSFSKIFACKKIISIHENRELIPYDDNLTQLNLFDRVIVACEPAKKILSAFNVQSEVFPYYLKKEEKDHCVNFLVDLESPIIASGVVDFRKGVHRFIEIAKKMPTEHFLWIGSTDDVKIEKNRLQVTAYNFRTIDYKIGEKISTKSLSFDIPKNVKFLGLVKDPLKISEIFSKAKCLLMISTDDPFPLVVIESKLLNKNVVNLKESGDSFKVCDDSDLVLEKYDCDKIIEYLTFLKPNPVFFNKKLAEYLKSNAEKNRQAYLSLLK